MEVASAMEVVAEDNLRVPIEERIAVQIIAALLMNFDADFRSYQGETVNALQGIEEHYYVPKKLDLDLKILPDRPAKPSIEELPILVLKQLPSHLSYVFLGTNNTLHLILSVDLNEGQVRKVVRVI